MLILIGGTGRSGTTILGHILGQHPHMYCIPQELRFHTDPDGLINLEHALVDDWSFFQADIAVDRFLRLLKHLERRSVGAYPTTSLASIVGKDFYREWVAEFRRNLIRHEFRGNWAARANLINKFVHRIPYSHLFRKRLLESNYYTSPMTETQFQAKVFSLVEHFMNHIRFKYDAGAIIETTPSNILNNGIMRRYLPDVKVIHIYRDPRDVAASFVSRDWAADDPMINIRWIVDVHKRWEHIKRALPNESYVEIKFEDLVYAKHKTLVEILEFLSLSPNRAVFEVALADHHIGRWKSDFPPEVATSIHEACSPILDTAGYT